MTLALRVDVDNPFGYATLLKKALNRLSLDYDLVPRWESLGYLAPAIALKAYLDRRSAAATWFFRNITAPHGKTLREFSIGSHELALHSERSETYQAFHAELAEWKKRLGVEPLGFSKHGSGDLKLSRKHDKEYNPGKLTAYAKRLGLRYFSGNGTQIESRPEVRDGFVYVPSAYWVDNPGLHPSIAVDQAAKYSDEADIVAIVHPIWWVMKRSVREDLELLLNRSTTITLRDQVRLSLEKSEEE